MLIGRSRFLGLCLVVLGTMTVAVPRDAVASERYFVTVFGAQTTPKIPKFTHTWLAIIRWVDDHPGHNPWSELKVVSWMPGNFEINTLALFPESGVNLCMDLSLKDAMRKDLRISMWGPYELHPAIAPQFYARVCQQVTAFENGQIQYRCLPAGLTLFRPFSNCVHAVTDIVPEKDRALISKIRRYGDAGSEFAVHTFAANHWINPRVTDDWVIPILGIEDAPVVRREYRRRYQWGAE